LPVGQPSTLRYAQYKEGREHEQGTYTVADGREKEEAVWIAGDFAYPRQVTLQISLNRALMVPILGKFTLSL